LNVCDFKFKILQFCLYLYVSYGHPKCVSTIFGTVCIGLFQNYVSSETTNVKMNFAAYDA
jgi:hypothetical protein